MMPNNASRLGEYQKMLLWQVGIGDGAQHRLRTGHPVGGLLLMGGGACINGLRGGD
jgi:hypothetical protein